MGKKKKVFQIQYVEPEGAPKVRKYLEGLKSEKSKDKIEFVSPAFVEAFNRYAESNNILIND